MAKIYNISLSNTDGMNPKRRIESLKRYLQDCIKRDCAENAKNDIIIVSTENNILRTIIFNDNYLNVKIIESGVKSECDVRIDFEDYELYCALKYLFKDTEGISLSAVISDEYFTAIIHRDAPYKFKFAFK